MTTDSPKKIREMDHDIIMTDTVAAAQADQQAEDEALADAAETSEIRKHILRTRPPHIPPSQYRSRLRGYRRVSVSQVPLTDGEKYRYWKKFHIKLEELVAEEKWRRRNEAEIEKSWYAKAEKLRQERREKGIERIESRAAKRHATEDELPQAKRIRTTDGLKDDHVAAQPFLDDIVVPDNNITLWGNAVANSATELLKSARMAMQQCFRSGLQMAATFQRRFESIQDSRETRENGTQGDNWDANAQLQAELNEHITNLSSLSTIIPSDNDPAAAQLHADLTMHASSSFAAVEPHMPPTNTANSVLQDQPMINQDIMAPEEGVLQEEPMFANQAEVPADAHEEPGDQATISDDATSSISDDSDDYIPPPPLIIYPGRAPEPRPRPRLEPQPKRTLRVIRGRTRSIYIPHDAEVDMDELRRQLEAEENGEPYPAVEPEGPTSNQADDAQDAVPPAEDIGQQSVVEAVAEVVAGPVEPIVERVAEPVAPQHPVEVAPGARAREEENLDEWVYRPGVPPVAPWLGRRVMVFDEPAAPAAPEVPALEIPAPEVPAPAPVATTIQVVPAPIIFAPPTTPAPAPALALAQHELETEVEETTDQLAATTVLDEEQAARDRDRNRDRDPTGRSVEWYHADTPMGRPVSAVQLFNVASPPVNTKNRTAPLRQAEWRAIEAENRRREEQELRKERDRLIQEKKDSLGRVHVPTGEAAVAPLSDSWEAQLERVMSGPSTRTLVTTQEGAELNKQKLDTCFVEEAWLNDEVINGHLALTVNYLRRVTNNCGRNVPPKYYAFNSFFYSKLREHGYQAVERWTRRAKINGKALLDVEMVFVPVHQNSHWTLLVLSPKNRTIEYFDSLWSSSHPFVNNIKKWLKGELGDLYQEDEWYVLNSTSQKQDNTSDCGVFLLTTAKAVALGLEPSIYGPSDIPLIRRKIVAELLNGGLEGDFEPALDPGERRL